MEKLYISYLDSACLTWTGRKQRQKGTRKTEERQFEMPPTLSYLSYRDWDLNNTHAITNTHTNTHTHTHTHTHTTQGIGLAMGE